MNIIKHGSQNKLFIIGLVILLPLFIFTLAAPIFTQYSPTTLNVEMKLMPPSLNNWFGTDEYGRDLFSRVIYGSQISMRVAAAATFSTVVLGVLFGSLAGFYNLADLFISRICDALLNFPGLIIGIMVMAALGQSEINIILAMVIMYTPRIVRVVRASVIEIKAMDFIDAAKVIGASNLRILFFHILPHTISPLVVQITFGFAWAILVESGLSFLGLGTPPPAPSWGNIISDGREFIRTAPWIMIFPGLMIAVAVTGLNLIGDGLREILDPRLRNTSQKVESTIG
jgi:peptide/nickel transport system permease protein